MTRRNTPTELSDSADAAIYCRKSKKGDKEQITVSRQKKLAEKDCEKLGLNVRPGHVFIDNGASAWQHNRKRPGWDALLEAVRRGEIKHIVCYHPDRLMRQPHDLEELLSLADRHEIKLYGRVNRRDLQDPDDRYALRIEVAHACRSSDDTSRRLKDERRERAENGRPAPGGIRRYGYSADGMRIIKKEAEIVKEVFRRYTRGEGAYIIANDLNERKIKTVKGGPWAAESVRRLIKSHHVAGIHKHLGEETGAGIWPAIIDRPLWDLAQETRQYRAATMDKTAKRFFLLRGAMVCGKCGTHMSGTGEKYTCTRHTSGGDRRCARSITASRVEEFVTAAAVRLLTELKVEKISAKSQQAKQVQAEIEEDERELEELKDMWRAKELKTKEYREMRAEIVARMERNEKKSTVRPIKALEGLTGPNAAETWQTLTGERKNATIRFLFTVVISESNDLPVGEFDYGRIDIEENEIG